VRIGYKKREDGGGSENPYKSINFLNIKLPITHLLSIETKKTYLRVYDHGTYFKVKKKIFGLYGHVLRDPNPIFSNFSFTLQSSLYRYK